MDRVARRGPLARAPGALKGGHFRSCVFWKTLWREKFFREVSQCRKTERGDPLGFFNINSVAKHQKIEGGNFFPEKSLAVPKKFGSGDPLVSPGMVCYAGKQEKPFWFSSLDQIVQFGAIIFCRTFKNYFGQFVWIEKKPL